MARLNPRLRRRLRERPQRGIPVRTIVPNAITLLALCFGLSAVRFAIAAQWELAIGTIIVAAVLDGLDGRIARMLHGESRFGAELDSLSDAIAFGVAPAIVIYLWSLQYMPQFGWTIALSHAACCALRLARFNSQIDAAEQPRKAAGFFTGIPAPAGAGTVFLPLYLWLATGMDVFRSPYLVAAWTAAIAALMVSNLPTLGWAALGMPRELRFGALAIIAIVCGALINAPWPSLSALTLIYLAAIPFSVRTYNRIRRQRAALVPAAPASPLPGPPAP